MKTSWWKWIAKHRGLCGLLSLKRSVFSRYDAKQKALTVAFAHILWHPGSGQGEPIKESPGLFRWRGHILRDPEQLEDGSYVVVDAETGALVYAGAQLSLGDGPRPQTRLAMCWRRTCLHVALTRVC